ISGLSTIGSISFGIAFVAGKKRVPNPATGKTALRTGLCMNPSIACPGGQGADYVPQCLAHRQAELYMRRHGVNGGLTRGSHRPEPGDLKGQRAWNVPRPTAP